jgi:hypothetical protein
MQTPLYLRASTAQKKQALRADGLHRYATRARLAIVAEFVDMPVLGRQEVWRQLDTLVCAARHHAFAGRAVV